MTNGTIFVSKFAEQRQRAKHHFRMNRVVHVSLEVGKCEIDISLQEACLRDICTEVWGTCARACLWFCMLSLCLCVCVSKLVTLFWNGFDGETATTALMLQGPTFDTDPRYEPASMLNPEQRKILITHQLTWHLTAVSLKRKLSSKTPLPGSMLIGGRLDSWGVAAPNVIRIANLLNGLPPHFAPKQEWGAQSGFPVWVNAII